MVVCLCVHLPLRPVTPGTPAAAAGSRGWGWRRSARPWRRSDTPPSCSGWRSSGRPPPWWSCGTHLQGCSRVTHTARSMATSEKLWLLKQTLTETYQWTRQDPPFRRHLWMKLMHSLKCCELKREKDTTTYYTAFTLRSLWCAVWNIETCFGARIGFRMFRLKSGNCASPTQNSIRLVDLKIRYRL